MVTPYKITIITVKILNLKGVTWYSNTQHLFYSRQRHVDWKAETRTQRTQLTINRYLQTYNARL